jgi:hypothetical protein
MDNTVANYLQDYFANNIIDSIMCGIAVGLTSENIIDVYQELSPIQKKAVLVFIMSIPLLLQEDAEAILKERNNLNSA